MTHLSYNAISLLLWLKDEAIDIHSYQEYPAGIDPQSYLPMSFTAQRNALDELETSKIVQIKRIDSKIHYLIGASGNIELSNRLDIYGSGVSGSELVVIDHEEPLKFG